MISFYGNKNLQRRFMTEKITDFGISRFKLENNLSDSHIGRIVQIYNKKAIFYNENGKQFETTVYQKEAKNFLYSRILVGDYVKYAQSDHSISAIFPRQNTLSKAESKASLHAKDNEQYLAANIDDIVVMIAVNQRFTVEKLERYLETFSILEKEPIVLLTKTDFKEGTVKVSALIKEAYPNLAVTQLSIFYPETIEKVRALFKTDHTVAVIGASGVGKSTLLNKLSANAEAKTGRVRSGDEKGRHTTTSISLHALSCNRTYYVDTPGFKVIDTTKPGNRPSIFNDIYVLAKDCKFRNCRHITEPKCAVKRALATGNITEEHYQSFLKYQERANAKRRH